MEHDRNRTPAPLGLRADRARRRFVLRAAWAVFGVACALPLRAAHACTICHDDAAVVLRAMLLEQDPLINFAALAAPVPLLIASVVATRWLAPWIIGGRAR